jgi:hypothetical protein
MSGNDQLTDGAELRHLRDSFSGIPMPGRPRLEAITARGRARRRRRLAGATGLCAVGAAAGTVLALGLTGVAGPARAHGTIRTAAFTLISHADGTDTLTLKPAALLDPAALQRDLQAHGIPAMVTSGSFCTSDPPPDGFTQVVTLPGPGSWTPQSPPTMTIDPSAMPPGAELSIGYFQLRSGQAAGEQEAALVLIDTSSYTCSTTPPDLSSPPAGYDESNSFGLLYGGPGLAGY